VCLLCILCSIQYGFIVCYTCYSWVSVCHAALLTYLSIISAKLNSSVWNFKRNDYATTGSLQYVAALYLVNSSDAFLSFRAEKDRSRRFLIHKFCCWVWTRASEWVSRGLTSHSTLYRSFRGRFLHARWPNQQCKSTEGSQLATEIGFSPTRTTPLCYNMN